MHTVRLAGEDDFEGWRDAARSLAALGAAPDTVIWQVGGARDDLFGEAPPPPASPKSETRVPRRFVELVRSALLHRDPERFALGYALLVRLADQPRLIDDAADPLVRRLETMAKAVRRDIHKMRAFVRFRAIEDEGGDRYIAWFEPDHHIVHANAAFFVNRFASMRWSILTPALSLHWDSEMLREGPGASKRDAPGDDPVEAIWKTYYASIFNPARLKTGAMLKEMPRKYWKNMPETALVGELVATARQRESAMIDTARTATGGNIEAAWQALRDEAASCRRCSLYKNATQTVFGEGPLDAAMMLIGEQPGDQEDLAGRPFVGPAGQVLDTALGEAGIDRARLYVTNAVKHFKFTPRGKRRIHAKPDSGEIEACRWWVEQEKMLVKPKVSVALGATAARSLLGKTVTIGRERGRPIELAGGGVGWITVHPSYLLRIPEADRAAEETNRFVADLKAAYALAAG
ncbi:UdgX family uracil-DNA binding protein [Stakelama sp. CBK3Z-3]|uniref:UdgX family uracil-DNA binding protein n=1 Tax=Stakelama flava TaxID=2860338 RepID=A0ABS6XPW5_9SPHN|nr:UdgX family uracil-DNA binding protein [Stakelama flava]MBW4331924.1 UdgX family uracil-DNA binding protein [Stakelama flava]